MHKKNAIKYLKYLHKLEREFASNLLLQEQKELVASVRATFLKEYRGKQ